MNKKRLSVVMAGAMLASSVAPVLAAEVQKSEHSANELGLLMEELRTLVESKTFSNDSKNAPTVPGGLPNLKGKSVYAIYVNGKVALGLDKKPLDVHSTQADWQHVFNALSSGDKVEVLNKGFKEVDGKIYGYEYTEASVKKYTKDDLKSLVKTINDGVLNGSVWGKYSGLIRQNGATYDENTGRLTIEFLSDVTVNGENFNTIVFDTNTTKKDLDKYFTDDSQDNQANITSATTPGDFYGFPESTKQNDIDAAGYKDIASSTEREITITAGGYDFNISDLYDGLMLTEKGHDFFELIKESRSMDRDVTIEGNYNKTKIAQNGVAINNIENAIKLYQGKGKFTITLGAKDKLAEEKYTITGDNEANLERLAKWMIKPLARVDILAGADRYETAVKIAKEYAGLTSVGEKITTSRGANANIVLVNGSALVDGLAAAPLAATKTNEVYVNGRLENVSAPILLTESGSLPKATKTYLKQVLANVQIGQLGKVTIHLVGGEAVLNKSLERELKGLGFDVERYGGDDREATSLAVADAMGTKSEAFVVGANGEADAMSIAAVAAETKTPIIVSNFDGLSEDALYELKGTEATIIGGDKAVSKADYDALKAEAKGVLRIEGEDRKATNAEIIKKYYKNNFLNAKNIIVAKDGYSGKGELVDALAAANMASEKNAPIVLATDSLSKEQINALILNAKNAEALYQVGNGVARDVVKTIATQLGLTNR